jgi:hypothetical protein
LGAPKVRLYGTFMSGLRQAVMAVVVIDCAATVDAAATIPSLALMVAAKMPLLPLPSTAASINNDCYCCCQLPPLPPSTSAIAAAIQLMVNSGGGLH